MPIFYDPQTKLFRLDTNTSSYAFMVYEENYLVHLYYGPRVTDQDLQPLMYRGWYDSLSPRNPQVSDPRFTLDVIPQECPGTSTGDFRISAAEARNAAGNTVTDLRYVGHSITPGKPALPGLPATFAQEGQAQTLEIEMAPHRPQGLFALHGLRKPRGHGPQRPL